jgi:hypothetical protein
MSLFPEPPDRGSLKAMTVNERLFTLGLLDQFDDAVRAGDRSLMITILEKVELGEPAEKIAEAILADPARYGRVKKQPPLPGI